jgi:hypothetical protein
LGIQELFKEDDLMGRFRSEVGKSAPRFDDRDCRQLRKVDLHRAIELQLIQQRLAGLGRRIFALEFKLTKAGFNRFGTESAVMIGLRYSRGLICLRACKARQDGHKNHPFRDGKS